MKQKGLSLAELHLDAADEAAVLEVLRSGRLREGKKVAEFEQAFARRFHLEEAVAASSGTAALHLSYLALLKPGDEVLVTGFTFIATASMIAMAGAKPVFCDVDPETFLLDLNDAETRLTPRTRAIAPVHLFGNACDIENFQSFAGKHNLHIIWDAAQALGTRYQGKELAEFGPSTCFSFYPSKNMTTGEGGMIASQDKNLIRHLRLLKAHGQSEKYSHQILGLNYRMSEIEAAIGLGQLKKLDGYLEARKRAASGYRRFFQDNAALRMQRETPRSEHSYNYFSIALNLKRFSGTRDEFVGALKKAGVPAAIHYPVPLHLQPCFAEGDTKLPHAESLSLRILSLPMHPFLSDDDVAFVARTVNELTHQMAAQKVVNVF